MKILKKVVFIKQKLWDRKQKYTALHVCSICLRFNATKTVKYKYDRKQAWQELQ